MERSKKPHMLCFVLAACGVVAMATREQDEKHRADQLTNLAACIPFVSGTANKPTPGCYEDIKKVRSAKPKCLCVLIKKSSTDPSIGLPINTTLAKQISSACNIDAKVSDCPSILNLPADSPDAKIFKTAGDSCTTSKTSSPPASTSSTSGSSQSPLTAGSSASDSRTTATGSSNAGAKLCQSILVNMGLASTILIFI